jgi:hypothetical protein
MTQNGLDVLTLEDCVARLEEHRIGRVALLVDEYPLIVPVNYRLVTLPGPRYWVAIRTRPGGIVDRAAISVAFEIDDINAEHREGWSVVVRGTLHHIDPDVADFGQRFDPDSWVPNRNTWMVIEAFQITGRALHRPDRDWEIEFADMH